MSTRILFTAAAAALLAGTGCTAIVGGIEFDGTDGGATATTSSSTGTESSTTSSSSGTGGSASSSSTGGSASSSSTGGSSSSSTGGSGGSGTGGAASSSSSGGASCTGVACEANATCSVVSGSPICTCDSGYIEHPVGTCIPDPCQGDPCNGNGTCSSATGVAVCTCMPPYVGATCDSCVYLVDGSAAAGGDGSTWAKAFNTIQPALDAANTIAKTAGSCDVWVKAGTYYLFKSDKVADGIHLYSNVGLYGGFAGTETQRTDADPAKNPTTISGYKSASGGTSVEHVVAGYDVQNATVDGFTLRDGNADGSGGNQEDSHGGGFLLYAYNTHNASATVSRCEITASSGSYGAGIGMIWGNPTITVTSCNVHGNTASGNGGGMECSGTSCTVSATTFQGNVAGNDGGGLYSGAGLVANGDTFADNIATTNGGGLRLSGVAGALTNLVFSGNYAGGDGGAVHIQGPPVSGVTNGVFVGNHAVGSGGAVYDQTSAFTCIGCTITGNHAEQQGDAIDWQTSAPTLTNSIVWGNPSVEAAASGDDVMPATWTTITASHADVHGYSGTSSTAFDADPLFVSVPAFFDVVASTGVSSSFVIVAGSGYTVGDVIEIGGDGVGRTVSQVSASVVTFSPAVAAAPPAGTAIRDWGSALATLDLHVSSGSMCIADGDASQGLSTDITGASWGGNPTLGAYTYP